MIAQAGSMADAGGRRLERLMARARVLLHPDRLVHDLAKEVGSHRWYRGVATLAALAAAALSFWPDFSAVEAAAAFRPDDEVAAEARALAVAPLALGGASGLRHDLGPRVRPLADAQETDRVRLGAVLGAGDRVPALLARVGVGAGDLAAVSRLVSAAAPGGRIAPGTRFAVTLGQRPAPGLPRALESLAFRARFDLDLVVERGGDGALRLVRQPVPVDLTPLRVRGRVGGSFYRSARAAGAPVPAIAAWLRAVDQHLAVDGDLAPGDEFDMILSYRRAADGSRQAGDLLYAGVERAGRPRLQLVRSGGAMVVAGGEGQAEPAAPASAGIGQPVSGRITSRFGFRRHPILGYARMHAGVDYGAAWGAPIFAVADGVVSFAGRHGGHGNFVRLDHGGGLGTGYGHMSRIAVAGGMRVRAGQVIGHVGSTGLSTGPHLHFEAYRGGRPVNPLGLRLAAGAAVDTRRLDALRGRIAALMKVPAGAALADYGAGRERDHPAREIERLGSAPGSPVAMADPPARLAGAPERR